MKWRDDPASVRPMLATLAEPPLAGPGLVYEPKYDGIRALVDVPAGTKGAVRIWSRLGNAKTSQFPSIVRALDAWRATLRAPVLLDAEIVALDERGRPAGFQRLQGRIHVIGARDVERLDKSQPVALIAFDLLRDGDEDLRGLPLTERRARLEARLAAAGPARPSRVLPWHSVVRISEQASGDGRALHARATEEGWEGLIVKDGHSLYHTGRRTPAWRKLKLLRQQEFVVGGWTEPRYSQTGERSVWASGLKAHSQPRRTRRVAERARRGNVSLQRTTWAPTRRTCPRTDDRRKPLPARIL